MKTLFKTFILSIFLVFATQNSLSCFGYEAEYFESDLAYKKAILSSSGNPKYTLKALSPIMGPYELTGFLKNNDLKPYVYTPSVSNISKGLFRANLHMHTTNSDGAATVKERLDLAQKFAETFLQNGYVVIAITDHNTILGAKEVVKVLEENPNKYTRIKVVLGIEIFTEYRNSQIADEPIQIHVLTLCINPYNTFLNKEFYKKDLNDPFNRPMPDRNFDWVISVMSNYGITGPAHPARYTSHLGKKKYAYMTEMLTRYKKLNRNISFTEGYYQSYPATSTKEHLGDEYEYYIKYINNECKRLGILRSGSTDAHGKSMLKK